MRWQASHAGFQVIAFFYRRVIVFSEQGAFVFMFQILNVNFRGLSICLSPLCVVSKFQDISSLRIASAPICF
jgi:hypothetical protein